MTFESDQDAIDDESENLAALADELEVIVREKEAARRHIFGEKGDVVMRKFIGILRSGEADRAKLFLSNESDKLNEYRKDGIPLLIQKLYGGSGSPWFTVERDMRGQKVKQENAEKG